MSPEEVIAATAKQISGNNLSWASWKAYAGVIRADLEAAGYAIVALPPPAKDLWDESDVALFHAESCTPIRLHWSGQVIYGSDWLNPSEARSDAAALLAAADLAEQESAE